MSADPSDFDADLAALVADVADDYRARRARGEDPRPDEYVARHPGAADAVRGVLDLLRMAALSDSDPSTPPAGRVLGDFQIVREVGRGGMGVVYEAEQLSLGRRVALKVLPFATLADSRLLQRFKNEARAAAGLDHPHIVRVHAVGQDRGTHFLAMQFIDGRPLSDFIRGRQVAANPGHSPAGPDAPTVTNAAGGSVPDTALAARPPSTPTRGDGAYFRQVATWGVQAAEALEHAHSLGIVHRDVKPGNLLLDSAGNVWVADFGLAKLLHADAGVTVSGDVLGTLRYMSPEQAGARHGLVDHRTDVYALGATLYELLTGVPGVDGKDKAEILHRIAFADPVPPRKLDRGIPADLETIVLKCLTKDPAERFPSAGELAADLMRFLDRRPIVARPPSLGNRAGKWVGRHRAVVGAVVVGLVLALAGVSVGMAQAWHAAGRSQKDADEKTAALAAAERRLELTRRAADEMYTQVAEEWLAQQPRLQPKQREFLEKARAMYEDLTRESGNALPDRLKAAESGLKLALISRRLGDLPAAKEEADRAIRVLNDLVTADEGGAEELAVLSRAYISYGESARLAGDLGAADTAFQRAEVTARRLMASVPNRPEGRRWLANVLVMRGILEYEGRKRLKEAEPLIREALRLFEGVPDEHLGPAAEDMAQAHLQLSPLLAETGRPAAAVAPARRAVDLYERLSSEQPNRLYFRSQLLGARGNLGMVLMFTRAGDPEPVLREVLQGYVELVGQYPDMVQYRVHLAHSYYNMFPLVSDRATFPGELDRATALRRAAELMRGLVAEFPKNVNYQRDLGFYLYWLARKLQDHQSPEAVDAHREALAVRRHRATEAPGAPGAARDVGESQGGLAIALLLASPDDAAAVAEADGLTTEAVALAPKTGIAWRARGEVRYRMGDWAGAVRAWEQARALREGGGALLFLLAAAYHRAGEEAKARQCFADATRAAAGMASTDLSRTRGEAEAVLGLAPAPPREPGPPPRVVPGA